MQHLNPSILSTFWGNRDWPEPNPYTIPKLQNTVHILGTELLSFAVSKIPRDGPEIDPENIHSV